MTAEVKAETQTRKVMKTIIGYTDSITECECCGKTDLKGTYCVEIDGVELYYGSVCAFKVHGVTTDEQKELRAKAKKESKLNVLLSEGDSTNWHKNRIVRFIRKSGLDLISFVTKRGVVVDENRFYIAYEYGNEVFTVNK